MEEVPVQTKVTITRIGEPMWYCRTVQIDELECLRVGPHVFGISGISWGVGYPLFSATDARGRRVPTWEVQGESQGLPKTGSTGVVIDILRQGPRMSGILHLDFKLGSVMPKRRYSFSVSSPVGRARPFSDTGS